MKILSLTLATTATAALMALSACDRNELSTVNVESQPQAQPNSELLIGTSLGEGHAMTEEEVAQLMAMNKNNHAIALQNPSASVTPLAKTAATTCIVDFNSQAILAALPNHGSNTFITGSYNHSCYNNPNVYMMTSSYNLDHFHLDWEGGAHCYAGGNNWGLMNAAGACVNKVSDAMYWPRTALNMNSNSGVAFNAVANGYYKNFNLVGFYLREGTAKLAVYINGTGWRWYGPCTPGQRWYMGATTTVSQAIFFENNYSGVISVDNVEAQILY